MPIEISSMDHHGYIVHSTIADSRSINGDNLGNLGSSTGTPLFDQDTATETKTRQKYCPILIDSSRPTKL
jgi:hypothetical protein